MTKTRSSLLFAGLAFATPARAPAQSPQAPIQDLCRAAAPEDGPGFVVLVALDGQVLHRAAYGLGDLTSKTKLQPETPFYAASVSKAFTAACVLHLAASGRISLEEAAGRRLKELDDVLRGITVGHLLQHRSGLRDFYELEMLTARPIQQLTTARVLELLARQKAGNFEPGSDFLYSNSGYLLLGELVARVSGASLHDYAAKNLFEPLGMRDTRFRDEAHPSVEGLPTAYEHGETAIAPPLLVGPGGLITTVDDLHRWLRALTSGSWQPQLMRALITPPTIAPELRRSPALEPYAGGLLTVPFDGHQALLMLGGFGGWQALALSLPTAHVEIVILANGDLDVRRLAHGIVAAVTGKTVPETAKTGRPPGFQAFQADDGDLAFVATRSTGATVLTTLGYKVQLAERDGRLVGVDCGLPVAVELGESLNVTIAEAAPRTYRALAMQRLAPAEADLLAGRWRSEELDALIELRAASGRLTFAELAPGVQAAPFQPLQRDLWISDTGLRIDVAARDGEGRAEQVRISTGRARGIVLKRG